MRSEDKRARAQAISTEALPTQPSAARNDNMPRARAQRGLLANPLAPPDDPCVGRRRALVLSPSHGGGGDDGAPAGVGALTLVVSQPAPS